MASFRGVLAGGGVFMARGLSCRGLFWPGDRRVASFFHFVGVWLACSGLVWPEATDE